MDNRPDGTCENRAVTSPSSRAGLVQSGPSRPRLDQNPRRGAPGHCPGACVKQAVSPPGSPRTIPKLGARKDTPETPGAASRTWTGGSWSVKVPRVKCNGPFKGPFNGQWNAMIAKVGNGGPP